MLLVATKIYTYYQILNLIRAITKNAFFIGICEHRILKSIKKKTN